MTQSRLLTLLVVVFASAPGCRQAQETPQPKEVPPVAQSREMGGAKSVMTFFVTSKGPGKGGDLGGLTGADHTARHWRRRKVRVITRGGHT